MSQLIQKIKAYVIYELKDKDGKERPNTQASKIKNSKRSRTKKDTRQNATMIVVKGVSLTECYTFMFIIQS